MKELFKIAGKILDPYDDPAFIADHATQRRIGKTIVDPSDLGNIPDSQFAIKIAGRARDHRRYPVYNEEMTRVSCAYFDAVREDLPPEIEKAAGYNLQQACIKHDLAVPDYLSDYEPVDKVVPYVSAKTDTLGVGQEKIAEYVQEQLWFEFSRLPGHRRNQAADDFCKTAGLPAVTNQSVWDYATKPVIGPEFDACLDERYELLKAASKSVLIGMLEDIRTAEDQTPAQAVEKLAALDEMAGFTSRYSDGFPDPHYSVYAGHELPSEMIKQAEFVELEKLAKPLDPSTGAPLDPEASRGMSTAQHLAGLQRQYPKGTTLYKKAQDQPVSEDMKTDWGKGYTRARAIYFTDINA